MKLKDIFLFAPKRIHKGIKSLTGNVFVGKNLYAYVSTPNWRKYKEIFETYGFKTKNIGNTLLVFKPEAKEKDVEREFYEIQKLQAEGKLEKLLGNI